ncbi:MAG: PAS domain S-box protein [Nitrospiraceae bacterium]
MRALVEQLIERWKPFALGGLTVTVLLATFVIDLMTQRGIAAWALYPIAILIAKEWRGKWAVVATALVAAGLTVLGAMVSPAGHAGIDFVNRIFAIVLISLVGVMGFLLERKEEAHQQTEASRQHYEITLRSVVQSAADSIVLADGEGNILSWNKAATAVFGYREREVLGKALTMLMPERYRAAHQRGLEHVRKTGESKLIGHTVELHGLRKDGSEFPLELSLASWHARGEVYFSGIIRDISVRKREESHLAAQYAVTRALADSATLAEAAPRILQAVCDTVGWEVGAIWIVDADAQALRCNDIWHVPSITVEQFESATREMTFSSGIGLPGRVWSSGKPAWITDVVQDSNFPRVSIARRAGLHGAFAFPILSGSELTGVIEFFSRQVRKPDEHLLLMMGALGSQIGLFLSRRLIEAERERLLKELQEALTNIKTLRGLLPICAACKKVRDDSGYWNRIEDYVRDRSEAEFTHGICPECARKMHPDWDEA